MLKMLLSKMHNAFSALKKALYTGTLSFKIIGNRMFCESRSKYIALQY